MNQGQPNQDAIASINKMCKVIRFQFPDSQTNLLRSYVQSSEFQQWIRDCSKACLGFAQIIKFKLAYREKQISANILKIQKEKQKQHGGIQQQFKRQHNWRCQICTSYFTYSWDQIKKVYILESSDKSHAHFYENFKDYLARQMNQNTIDKLIQNNLSTFSQKLQHQNDLDGFQSERIAKTQVESMYQQSEHVSKAQQNEEKQTLKENPQKRNDEKKQAPSNIYEKRQDESQNQNLQKQGNKKSRKRLKSKASQQILQKFKIPRIKQSIQQMQAIKRHKLFKKSLPDEHTIWSKQSQSLILFLKPHYFQCPKIQDLPESLPIDVKMSQLNENLKKICRSYNNYNHQIWQTNVTSQVNQQRFLNIQNINPFSPFKKKFKIQCYCYGSLITQCPFSIVYSFVGRRQGEFKYVLNSQQSNFQHQHIEEYIPFKKTKFLQIFNTLPLYKILPQLNKSTKQKFLDYYIQRIFPRVIKERFEGDKSILMLLNQRTLKKLFQLRFVICSHSLQLKNYEQVKNIMMMLLTDKQVQNDVILVLAPQMQKLFKVYNRLLVIQNKKIFQNFSNHRKYTLFLFKGISYTGTQIYLAIALVCDATQIKIQNLLATFMSKHSVIPNMLLISQSNMMLYETAHRYFDQNYPQTVIRTRQLCIKKHNKLFLHSKTGKMEYMLLSLTQLQKSYLQLSSHNKFASNMLKYTVGEIFQYDSLVKTNSCFLENGSFIGLDLKTAAHFYDLRPPKIDALNQTNIWQAQKRLLQSAQNAVKSNKRQHQKDIFGVEVQKILKISQLQNLRILMARNPFRVFLLRLLKVSQISIQVSNPPHFYIVESNFNSNIVTMNPARKNPLLLCDCRLREKTGIPCEHIIKIALIQQLNFMDCIDKFWLVDSLAAEQYASDFSLQQIMKSKISPMYAMSEARKRVFDKLFKRMNKRKVKKPGRSGKQEAEKIEEISQQD